MTYETHQGVPCPPEHRDIVLSLLTSGGSGPTRIAGANWPARIAWCQLVLEMLRDNQGSLKPVRADKWAYPTPQDMPEVKGDDDDAREQRTELARRDVYMRLHDARDESMQRLRTTMQCEAWLREIDVTHPAVQKLATLHQLWWGITEPVSDDFAAREAVVQWAVREKVR